MQSVVLSVIHYCVGVWGSTNNALLHTVQKLMNFAKVAVGGARRYDHVTPIMKRLKWLNVEDKCFLDKCSAVYRAANGLYPKWYLKFSTGTKNKVQGKRITCMYKEEDCGARAITVCAPKQWNLLPHDIVNSRHLHSFKA